MNQKPLNKMITPLTKDKSEVLDRAETFINDKLSQAQKELDAMQEQLEDLKKQAAQALEDMEAAVNKSDADTYLKATMNHAKAKAQAEALKELMTKKQAEPLIDQDEYSKYSEAIRAAACNHANESAVKLTELAEAMEVQANELETLQARTNNALHRLQYDLFKNADADYCRDVNGNIIYPRKYVFDEDGHTTIVPGEPVKEISDNKIDLSFIINWGRRATRCNQYREFTR